MDMTGERRIPAPRQVVWDALIDPEILKASIPGCESLEKQSDTAMTARAAVKVGPISARFTGNVQLSDLDPPNGYTISGEGQGGVAGFAKGGAKVALADDGADTLLRYEVHAQIGGKLAQLGARLVDASAKQMADQFFDRFSTLVAAAQPAALASEAVGEPDAAPIQAGAAGGAPAFPAVHPAPAAPRNEHERLFPSAPGSVVDPVLPPPHPPASVNAFSMIPREPFGLPIAAWVGGGLFVIVLLLYLGSIF
jgi:carbon monoxide dehydrogenase subunit G